MAHLKDQVKNMSPTKILIIPNERVSSEELAELEAKSKVLDPPQSVRSAWNEQVSAYTESYLDRLGCSKAYEEDCISVGKLKEPFRESGISMRRALDIIEESVVSSGTNQNSSCNFGFVPGSSTHPSMLADAVTSAVNLQTAVSMCSPGGVRVEMEIIRWICTEVIGYDPKGPSGGVLTSGGSSANMYAVATARDSVNLRARDYEKAVVYVSTEVHHCFVKAFRACGMRDCIVRRIAVDSSYKMTPDLLAEAIESDKQLGLMPLIVIATAGTTGTGTVDPLSQIAAIAEREKIWFHVDAAYGGFFSLANDDMSLLFDGWQMADSVTLDPHKSLFVPFGTGAFLVKNVKHLIDMYAADDVKYMPPRQGVYYDKLDPNMLCPEMSRGFRGLRVWLPLKVFGLGPIKAALHEKVMLCRYFYQEIQSLTDFEVGPYPEISICLFRYSPKLTNGFSQTIRDELNKRLLESINREGIIFLTSYTDSSGKSDKEFWLRLAVMNFKSHLCDIRQAIKTIRSKAESMADHASDINIMNKKLNKSRRPPLCRFNSMSY